MRGGAGVMMARLIKQCYNAAHSPPTQPLQRPHEACGSGPDILLRRSTEATASRPAGHAPASLPPPPARHPPPTIQ